MYRLLRDRRFALVALGHAVNGIGSWASLVAIWGYAVYKFDVGPTGLGLLAMAWGLPAVVLSPVAGLLIDRLGPRKVAITSDLFDAGVAFAMVFAGGFGPLLALATLHGAGKGFGLPAYGALPGRLVPKHQLFEANAVLSAANDLSIVGGPLVAAGAIAAFGTGAAFVFDGVSYLVGAAVLLPITLRPVDDATGRKGALHDIRDGLGIVRRSPGAAALLVLGFSVWLSYGTFGVLEPLYVRDVLDAPVTTFALLQTAFGVGLVGTGLALPLIRRRLQSTEALAVVVAAGGIAAATYAGTAWLGVAFVGVFAWGVCAGLFGAPARTLLMRRTPDGAHGRVLGTWSMLTNTGHLLPALVAGFLAGAVGPQVVLVWSGGVMVVVAAVTLLTSARRDRQAEEPVPHDAGHELVPTP